MTYYNERENPCQECQPYRTEKWNNHKITKRSIKLHTNNNPIKIKIIKSVNIEYAIKIKNLKVTYPNRNTKNYYYSFDKSPTTQTKI